MKNKMQLLKMPRMLVSVSLSALLLGGCVTTSQSKSEYQAKISGLEAEKAALNARLSAIEEVRRAMREQYEMLFMEWQRSEGRRSHKPGVAQ